MYKVCNIFFRLLILVGLSLTGACALTQETAKLSYSPQVNAIKQENAESISVIVEVIDSRTIKDKVSAKKNGYGMEMAKIISDKDVALFLKEAIETELSNSGFDIGEGDVLVNVKLLKFYNDFKVGMWAGDAVAEVKMTVQINKPDGSIGYYENILGKGFIENVMMASGENAQEALNLALQDAVAKLFEDYRFIQSIIDSKSAA